MHWESFVVSGHSGDPGHVVKVSGHTYGSAGRAMCGANRKLACSFHHSLAQVHRPHVKKNGTLPYSGSFLCVNKFVCHFRKEERGDQEGSAI